MPKRKKFVDLSQRQKNRRLRDWANVDEAHRKNDPEKFAVNGEMYLIESTHDIVPVEIKAEMMGENINSLDSTDNDAHDVTETNERSSDPLECASEQLSEKLSLSSKLIIWTNEYKIKQNALTALLKILKIEGHENLENLASKIYEQFSQAQTNDEARMDDRESKTPPKIVSRRKSEQISTTENGDETNNDVSSKKCSTTQSCHMCERFDARLNLMDGKLNTILALLNCENLESTEPFEGIDQLPHFPINSIEELKEFCSKLEADQILQKQFKDKILRIGGNNATRHISNVVATTLTNKLAKNLTWDGQRKTEGIKNTSYAKIIIHTVVNKHVDTSESELQHEFAEKLRRAGDKYNYHLKKHGVES